MAFTSATRHTCCSVPSAVSISASQKKRGQYRFLVRFDKRFWLDVRVRLLPIAHPSVPSALQWTTPNCTIDHDCTLHRLPIHRDVLCNVTVDVADVGVTLPTLVCRVQALC